MSSYARKCPKCARPASSRRWLLVVSVLAICFAGYIELEDPLGSPARPAPHTSDAGKLLQNSAPGPALKTTAGPDPTAADQQLDKGNDAYDAGNFVEAFRWYQLAAAQNLAKAQHNLGNLYNQGKGVTKNDAEALKWYTLAANQGLAVSEYNVGVFLGNGIGTSKDIRAATTWYERSAAHGYEEAEAALRDIRKSSMVAPNWAEPKIATGESRVLARGVGVVPGALICPDYRTAEAAFRDYSNYWVQVMQDKMTNGQAALLRGAALKPNLESWGCVLVPAGTPMALKAGNIAPVVRVESADGAMKSGVTIQTMFARP